MPSSSYNPTHPPAEALLHFYPQALGEDGVTLETRHLPTGPQDPADISALNTSVA